MDEVAIDISAPPEVVWDLITDVTRMGEWSPECYRCAWLDGGAGPTDGARFKGWNRQGPVRWTTTSTVVEAQPGEVFSFTTKEPAES